MLQITFNVAGTTFENRQGYLNYLLKNNFEDNFIMLRPEPNNEYDPNAIAVLAFVPKNNKVLKIGYVPKEHNQKIVEGLNRGQKIWIEDSVLHGGGDLNLSMKISIKLYTPRN